MSATVTEVELKRGVTGLVIENEHLAVTVLPDNGADIISIVHKASGFDPMWKSPWGLRRPGLIQTAPNSSVAWHEAYQGGWQELFPNGGTASVINGVELPYHGEASLAGWDWEVLPDGIRLFVRLVRSPFVVERIMRLSDDKPELTIEGRAENKGRIPLPYMWVHHPAFGPPFLDGTCVIETNATKVMVDPDATGGTIAAGSVHDWPIIETSEGPLDASIIPGEETPHALMVFLGEFADPRAWYAIQNQGNGERIEFAWDRDEFPYAWLWEELHFHTNSPLHGEVYTMAIEPATSWPGGLTHIMETTATHRVLEPGQVITNALTVTLSAS